MKVKFPAVIAAGCLVSLAACAPSNNIKRAAPAPPPSASDVPVPGTAGADMQQGKHLFILSGQSNMERFNPDETFTPAVTEAFGEGNVIVVKDALGGQPIRRWYKKWKPLEGEGPAATGDLYDSLMVKVNGAIRGRAVATVTFIWMQGERDAREMHGNVYGASLKGLLDQLKADLGRTDVNYIIGRLSDFEFDRDEKKYLHWPVVKEAQVAFAEADPRGAWVDTDDLNDGINRDGEEISNDLHYSVEGYRTLGRRYAAKAVELITENAVKAVND